MMHSHGPTLDRLRSALRHRIMDRYWGPPPCKPPSRHWPVVLFKNDRLGDLVLATSAIRLLLDRFGSDRCLLVVSEVTQELALREFPSVAQLSLRTSPAGGGLNGLWNWGADRSLLGGVTTDCLVLLRHHRNPADYLAMSWLQSLQVVGLADSLWNISPEDQERLSPRHATWLARPGTAAPGLCLELESHRVLLASLLGRKVAPSEILPSLQCAAGESRGGLVVCPFGSSKARDYPEAAWIHVVREIQRRTGLAVCLAGGNRERRRLECMAAALTSAGADRCEVLPARPFSDVCQVVADARAVLTVDTSVAHVATAMDKPAVVLIGGGHPGVFGPWVRSERQRWLTNPLPCFGCNWRCTRSSPECITQIPVGTVVSALLEVLNV